MRGRWGGNRVRASRKRVWENRIMTRVKTSEEVCQDILHVWIEPGKERRGCNSDDTNRSCVTWCGNNPFWNLVMGSVGLRVTGIWGESWAWKSHNRRCWTDIKCNIEGVRVDAECWESYWVLTEAGQLPEINHLFCKRATGRVLYVSGKHTHHTTRSGGVS